jgi:AcrR family transcriptional regulator
VDHTIRRAPKWDRTVIFAPHLRVCGRKLSDRHYKRDTGALISSFMIAISIFSPNLGRATWGNEARLVLPCQPVDRIDGVRKMAQGVTDRKHELVRIAYKLIAEKGFEGFRIRQVAAAAGIDNGTLHYHFPRKQDLIRGVVDHLLEQLRISRLKRTERQTLMGLGQLRQEFEELRVRLREVPEQFTVMTELFAHAQRHPDVARVLRRFREDWRNRVFAILESGMRDGSFRADLQADATAGALIAQFAGIICQVQFLRSRFLGARRLDPLIAEIRTQVERWVIRSESQPDGTKAARSAR